MGKFWEPETALRLCKAKDYPEVTRGVITEMHRQVGDLVFSPTGLAKSGLLVRHLAMPDMVEEGKQNSAFSTPSLLTHMSTLWNSIGQPSKWVRVNKGPEEGSPSTKR